MRARRRRAAASGDHTSFHRLPPTEDRAPSTGQACKNSTFPPASRPMVARCRAYATVSGRAPRDTRATACAQKTAQPHSEHRWCVSEQVLSSVLLCSDRAAVSGATSSATTASDATGNGEGDALTPQQGMTVFVARTLCLARCASSILHLCTFGTWQVVRSCEGVKLRRLGRDSAVDAGAAGFGPKSDARRRMLEWV